MIRINRRQALTVLSVGAASPLTSLLAQAQPAYPQRPIKLLVGSPVGGSTDNVARVVAEEMAKDLGQPIFIENRSGASANLAAQALVAAEADGHTLLLLQFSHMTNPALIAKIGYDPAKDLQMIGSLASLPVVALTRANSPFNRLSDVVAVAKQNGGQVTIGSGGNGTSSHIAAELLSRSVGIKYVHIPYKGGAQALQGLLSGDVDLTFDFMTPTMKSNAEAGKIKFLGAMQREPVASVPSLIPAAQQGIADTAFIRPWQGLAVRSGTPQAVLERLHRSLDKALNLPAVVTKLRDIGSEVKRSASPAEMQAIYLADLQRWTGFIRTAGIKPD